MIYNFDAMLDRKHTESVKWHFFDEDVLPMWVADMDFVSPEPVVRALADRVAHGIFGYPGDLPGLKEVIVERMAQRYGWQITPDDLVFVPGVVTGFNMAAQAIVGQGEGILIQPPVYMPFLKTADFVHGVLQEAPLTYQPDGTYSVNWEVFEAAITPETRMFL
ncbi:MAG TPA: putative C-S lyase, partial [Anaerolineaceae bacterium]